MAHGTRGELYVTLVSNDFILVLLVATALSFDFTNGFHDTGNAMATSIATGALPPKIAVAISGFFNLIGAFLSFSVAATIASGLVSTSDIAGLHGSGLDVIFAGLAGGIAWNLGTWLLGIPSSSSHALIGGIIGSTIAALGGHAVLWKGLVSKVVLPALFSPIIAGLVATIGTYLVYRLSQGVGDKPKAHGFRIGQIGSASMVSLAHGTNDAQKTMGIITLALIVNGTVHSSAKAPIWVIVACACAISLGTYIGGWRVIRTLGKGLVEIESPQGFAAESASTAAILLSSHFGYSLSTTHVATGSILGSGVGKRGAVVHWNTAGRMATAWIFTLPAAGLVGALAYTISHGIGGNAGAVVLFILVLVLGGSIYWASRKKPVSAHNVNDEWGGDVPAPTSAAA
jgi:inorganic phosphate transporter, PiT family